MTRIERRWIDWLLPAACTAVAFGSVWDVSWDASIGRHSLWSPPHLVVNFGALASLAAAVAGGAAGTRFRALIRGAAAAGAIGLLVAEAITLSTPEAPKDLEGSTLVALLGAGAALTLALAAWAHAWAVLRIPIVAAWTAGMALVVLATALGAYSLPNLQRTALFLQLSAAVYPAWIVLASRTAGSWPVTRAAAAYTMTMLGFVWVLPLFPATPASEPVYDQLTHMVAPRFPLLLLLPAFVFDLLRNRIAPTGAREVALSAGVCVALLLPAQWYFAAFLLSPASDHWMFAGGGRHWPFYVDIGAERALFWGATQSPVDATALAVTGLLAIISATLGLAAARAIGAAGSQG